VAETVRSYGAAMTVTGSCHLLEAGGRRLLVDCGAFQGSRALFALNREPLGFDPASLDAVVLTHAHLDHSGRLPLLERQGFRGRIHAPAREPPSSASTCWRTRPTSSARTRHAPVAAAREADEPLLSTTTTCAARSSASSHALTARRWTSGASRVHAPGRRPHPRLGEHGRGSAAGAPGLQRRRGNARKEILPDPTPCPEADVVFMEGTYGTATTVPTRRPFEEFAALLCARPGPRGQDPRALVRARAGPGGALHDRPARARPRPPADARLRRLAARGPRRGGLRPLPPRSSPTSSGCAPRSRPRSAPSTCATRARWTSSKAINALPRGGDRHRRPGMLSGGGRIPAPPDGPSGPARDHRDDRGYQPRAGSGAP